MSHQALDLLRQVYEQAGNSAPAERRHVLTPGLRDSIRDCLKEAESDRLPVTEEWLRAVGFETREGRLCLGARLQFTHCNGWNAWWTIDGLTYGSSRLVNGLNTRGHVRRLCQCLGIVLKEPR